MKHSFLKEPKSGDIFLSGQLNPGFYSRAVMWFTKSKWSHCFFLAPDYMGELTVFESELKMQIIHFEKEYIKKQVDYYDVFRPIKATEDQIYKSGEFTFKRHSGEVYGFFQIPWFTIRELCKRLLGIVLRKNVYGSGVICSELLLCYIRSLGGEYKEAVIDLGDDETSPQDIYNVVVLNPHLFEFIGKRS